MHTRAIITNIVGAFIAFALVGIIFGAQLEGLLSPIIVGPRLADGTYLPDPTVTNIHWSGVGKDARLEWQLDMCKLHNATLMKSSYSFYYIRRPEQPGVLVPVINKTRGTFVGESPLPAGCFRLIYSAELPDEPLPQQGDFLLSSAVYQSAWGFWWSLHEDFGTVVVPSSPPSGGDLSK